MKLPEKKQRWVLHEDTLPQPAGAGVTRRVLAYTDGLMCVENTLKRARSAHCTTTPIPRSPMWSPVPSSSRWTV